MAKQETAGMALQWGWTEMGEFYIKLALPIQTDEHKGHAPILAFVLTHEETEKLKASVSNRANLSIAKQMPKSNGHKLIAPS